MIIKNTEALYRIETRMYIIRPTEIIQVGTNK